MILKQLYTKCLAQGAYFLSSKGEAAIVDPLREVQPYLNLAEDNDSRIKYIFLTHFHADFVSGHLDLAQATGAQIILGPNAKADYDYYSASDDELFRIGDLSIQLIHTPGHTMESSCYLLYDEHQKPEAIFTGDTLFIGDVGRPDLAAKSDLTTQDLAGHLYDSLHNRIAPLPDDIIVYPAHGAGSACGKNMSSETSDTLGNQKQTNYAFKLDKEAFIKELTSNLAAPPAYFPENVAMNKKKNTAFDTIIAQGTKALSPQAFKAMAVQDDVLVLDTRDPSAFAKASIPGALFVGLNGQFAPWVGAIIPNIDQKIIFIAESGREEEVVTRLARVGYDRSLGFLDGGMAAWKEAGFLTDTTDEVEAQELIDRMESEAEIQVIDVRKPSEYQTSHIQGVPLFSLGEVHQNIQQLDPAQQYYIHCAGGYRSLIYASIAKQNGIDNVINVKGGYGAIKKANMSTTTLT